MGDVVTAQSTPAWSSAPPLRTSLRLVWLVGLVYAVASATHPGSSGRHLSASVLTATTAMGWAGWLTAQHRKSPWLSVAGIVILAASGGSLAVLHPIGVAVVAVAGMCAASSLDVPAAVVTTAPAVAAATIAVAATGHSAGVIASTASGMAAGLVVGVGRRQGQERARQEAELALARQRSEVDHQRAEVLADRNRIAREVHDVLAHTLSALSVQMEALSSQLEGAVEPSEIRAAVDRSRRLVTDGLDETRRAVGALRDEPSDVAEQIGQLSEQSQAAFRVHGRPRPLPAATGLALVRVAQEALTNALKHAPGGRVQVDLHFAEHQVELTVEDGGGGARSPLAGAGGGYGLQGMRERAELVGGSLSAGPVGSGWRVQAVVPT